MNNSTIRDLSGINLTKVSDSIAYHFCFLMVLFLWTVFCMANIHIGLIVIPIFATVFLFFFTGFVIEDHKGIHSPFYAYKIRKSKRYENFRKLMSLNNSVATLNEWLSIQGYSPEKYEKQQALSKFEKFVENGFKFDYLARMNQDLKNDTSLSQINIFEDNKSEDDVRKYIEDGLKMDSEMEKVYAELDKELGVRS